MSKANKKSKRKAKPPRILKTNEETNENISGSINTLSVVTVYLEMYFEGTKLASGTAFFVKSERGPVLITNRHNLTGRNQDTDKPIDIKHSGIPNHARFQIIGSHDPVWYHFDLIKDDIPVWVEHSEFNSKVDVVGVLFSELKDTIHRYANTDVSWYKHEVAERIHVIGYPFGMNENFGIWATGYIASEPDKNYNNLPAILVDCRARTGQSGSLVISRIKPGESATHKGKVYLAKKEMVHYIGVYSGRINNDSDLGVVWKMEVVRDIINTVNNSPLVFDNHMATKRSLLISSKENEIVK